MKIKHLALIGVFIGMISCNSANSQRQNYSVLKILEHQNAYDSSNCYSYVLIDEFQDSTLIKNALPALKKEIMAGSKKSCRTFTLIFLTPERHRKAIFESGYTDFRRNGKIPDRFTYYGDRYLGEFRMDENLKQLIDAKRILLPENTMGVWDDFNWAIVFFEKESKRYQIKYLTDGRENVNKRRELKPIVKEGKTYYRAYFANDYFGPDSLDYHINEFGDLESYSCFGYFDGLKPLVAFDKSAKKE